MEEIDDVRRVLDCLFPQGPCTAEIMSELAPEGWPSSPLARIANPTLEQALEEVLRVHTNLASLRGKDSTPEVATLLERTLQTYTPGVCEPERECVELIAMALWDVFTEHEVYGTDAQQIDLGSWRGGAGTIADWLNSRLPKPSYHYMDFYMGTSLVIHRADITPVYLLIFRRLREQGLRWRYIFPRLGLVSFSDQEPDQAFLELKAQMDSDHEQARQEARDGPPPLIVEAYAQVYGRFPPGWPP